MLLNECNTIIPGAYLHQLKKKLEQVAELYSKMLCVDSKSFVSWLQVEASFINMTSQQERDAKMQKRIAKLKTRQGQQTISQANEDEKHVEPASSEVAANLQIPEAWNTSIE